MKGIENHSLSWLWKTSKGIRFRLMFNSLLGIIRIIASLAFIYVSKLLVDLATGKITSSEKMYWVYSICLVALLACQVGAGMLNSWLSNQTEIKLKNKIRLDLFNHLMNASWDGKEKLHSGDVLNRLEEDVRVICDTLCQSLPSLFSTLVQLIAAFAFMCQLSPKMSWIILFILPIFLLFSKVYIKRTRALTSTIRNQDSQIQSIVQESIQHRIIIQSMEQNDAIVQKMDGIQSNLFHSTMQRTKFNLFSRFMVSIGFSIGYLVAFLWCIHGLYVNAITFGTMTAFLQLVGQIQRPTIDLTRQIPAYINATTSVDRLVELEVLPTEEKSSERRLSGNLGIRMNNVTFRYPDGEKDVLSNFTHDFRPGSRTAIIGETGSGKSTTIRLMLSLLHPLSGSMEIYSDDGSSIPVNADSRCNLIWVPQGNSLFSGTIRDNLYLGYPEATDDEMNEALYNAAAEFVSNLPEGLDTICGEQGAGLSEGQSQRIAIARALLHKGSILLLDELSSSLDPQTEQTLMSRLIDAKGNNTMIFVTHHEAIVDYCDEVVRL